MDEYYAKLIRSKLSEAQHAIMEAQNYAIEADAPGWLNSSLKRNLSSLRNRQDEILMCMNKAAQHSIEPTPPAGGKMSDSPKSGAAHKSTLGG